MKDRLVQLLEKEKISSAEFADRIGVQRSNVSHILNGRNNPGFSFIQKVLETYPNVNPRWLITGDGNMLSTLHPVTKQVNSDLFSSIGTNVTQSVSQLNKDSEVIDKVPVNNIKEQPKRNEISQPKAKRNIVRVVLFYDDNTFDDFSPTDKI